jgi:hypothetical protein
MDPRSIITGKIAGLSCLVSAVFFSVAAGLSNNILFMVVFLVLAGTCVLVGIYFLTKK